MCIDDEITNRPRLVIDDKILDVANLAVQGLDVITTHSMSAAQMVIPRFPTLVGFPPFFTVTHNAGISSPTVWAAPIHRVSIIPVVGLLELSRDGLVTVQGWTVLDLLFGQIDGDVLLFFHHGDPRIRGNQHLPARKPVSCVGDQIANRPVLVIEVEFLDPVSYTHLT